MAAQPPLRLFCFGLGYSAGVLARRVLAAGGWVSGTARTEEGCARLTAEGIVAHRFDRGHPLADPEAALAGVTHVLSSVPPDQDGDPVLATHGDALATLPRGTWLGYLSTTGVYGDHGGAWVDETTPVQATQGRQGRRVIAEQAWLALAQSANLALHIFRLAGIYGPGRSPFDGIRAGTARRIDKPGQVFSRIHVEDIATVLQASMARSNAGAVYNVCDDEPVPGHVVVEYACQLLGVAPPPLVPFAEASLSPMAASFYADNRRVRNDRIKQELGVTLAYPDYRAGLRALAPPPPPD